MTTEIQEYSPTEAALASLRDRMKDVAYVVTTTKGMEVAKADRAELRTLRTGLEARRVELKKPILERGRLLDAEAQRLTSEIVALEDPIDAQIKAEEGRKEVERQAKAEAERKRIQGLQDDIAAIRATPAMYVGKPSTEVREAMTALATHPMEFAELQADAETAADESMRALGALLVDAEGREAEAARIVAEAARLKAEREQLERDQAADKARRDAEEAASRERIAAQEREAAAVRAAEQKRLDDQQAEIRRQQAEVDRQRREQEEAAHQARLADQQRQEAVAAEQRRLAQEEEDRQAALRRAAADAEERRAREEREAAERAVAEKRAQEAKEYEAKCAAEDRVRAAAPNMLIALEMAEAFICGATNDNPLKTVRLAIAEATEEQTQPEALAA